MKPKRKEIHSPRDFALADYPGSAPFQTARDLVEVVILCGDKLHTSSIV